MVFTPDCICTALRMSASPNTLGSLRIELMVNIFLLAGNGLIYKSGNITLSISGTTAIFGDKNHTLAATALIAWIFVLLAMLALIAVSVLPLLKVKALDNISKMLTLACAGVLLIAGVLLFFTKLAFSGANNNYFDSYSTSFAFVFAGILAILSAACAACPAVLALLGKDK